MEVLSPSTTFGNEWKILWRKWLSTTPLLSNKSTSEVLLVPFWYANVESKVGKSTSLTMLELMTRLWTPSTTRELIECLFKVLDGTPVACGSMIGRGPDVVFKVSFSITIMSLMFSFKFWKLNNGVLTRFYATSRIWSWHSISWLVENCVFSLCTCIPGTWEFDPLVAYGVVVSSPSPARCVLLPCWEDEKIVAWLLELL